MMIGSCSSSARATLLATKGQQLCHRPSLVHVTDPARLLAPLLLLPTIKNDCCSNTNLTTNYASTRIPGPQQQQLREKMIRHCNFYSDSLLSTAITGGVMKGLSSLQQQQVNCVRSYSTNNNAKNHQEGKLAKYYHVEASNAERHDGTLLTVRGPDVHGIMASMTVALALRGCSLVEVHAAMAVDVGHGRLADPLHPLLLVQDVFFVVDRRTGLPFHDDELHDLAELLLQAVQSPMTTVVAGSKSGTENLEDILKQNDVPIPQSQITIIPSNMMEDEKS